MKRSWWGEFFERHPGATVDELVELTGLSRDRILRVAGSYGFQLGGKRRIPPNELVWEQRKVALERMVSAGLWNSQIAKEMGVSSSTVGRWFRKLGLQPVKAVRKALPGDTSGRGQRRGHDWKLLLAQAIVSGVDVPTLAKRLKVSASPVYQAERYHGICLSRGFESKKWLWSERRVAFEKAIALGASALLLAEILRIGNSTILYWARQMGLRFREGSTSLRSESRTRRSWRPVERALEPHRSVLVVLGSRRLSARDQAVALFRSCESSG